MMSIADQTAGPIGMKLFVDTHGCYSLKKKFRIFFQNIFFHGQSYQNLPLHKCFF